MSASLNSGDREEPSSRCVIKTTGRPEVTCRPAGVFFFGIRIRLRMTFNYPVLWVRVKGQG